VPLTRQPRRWRWRPSTGLMRCSRSTGAPSARCALSPRTSGSGSYPTIYSDDRGLGGSPRLSGQV